MNREEKRKCCELFVQQLFPSFKWVTWGWSLTEHSLILLYSFSSLTVFSCMKNSISCCCSCNFYLFIAHMLWVEEKYGTSESLCVVPRIRMIITVIPSLRAQRKHYKHQHHCWPKIAVTMPHLLLLLITCWSISSSISNTVRADFCDGDHEHVNLSALDEWVLCLNL